MSQDIVKANTGERMMDNWAIGTTDRLGRGEERQRRRRRRRSRKSFVTSPPSWPGRARARSRRCSPRPPRRLGSPSGCTKPTMRPRDIGRRDDARPIRARSASHGSSPPPIPEHREDPRHRAPARRSGPSNQRRPPASQSTQRRGITMKGADSRSMMLALRAWCDEDERGTPAGSPSTSSRKPLPVTSDSSSS